MSDETYLYRFFDSTQQLLYVGITQDLTKRRNEHKRTKVWWHEVASESFTKHVTREEAEAAEKSAIRDEQPRYNRAGAIPNNSRRDNERWVYVAGPISSDPIDGTKRAIHASGALMDMGVVPLVPHYSVFANLILDHSYDEWLSLDFKLIARCDGLLRLPGISAGADKEVIFAKSLGIPVFASVEEVQRWAI